MSERRECFCGRRTVFEFGLTDDDGNAHTWRSCGKDEDGQGLDVNTLMSERMEQVERAEQAEAAVQRVRGICEVIVENAHQFYEAWDEAPTAAQVPYGQWMVARHILRA